MSEERTVGADVSEALAGARLLVVDDEESLRDMLGILLQGSGAVVDVAAQGEAARQLMERQAYDAVITDISMPIMDGYELLRAIRRDHPEVPVLMMTAVNKDIAAAVQAIKEGAFDYIQKGFFNNDEFLRRVINAVEQKRLREENLRLRTKLAGRKGAPEIVGRSERLQAILSVVDRVAPTGSTVLVTGESGVGKELVAQALHHVSDRTGSFLTVNCGAFPDDLLESELFGHALGAFTGAVAEKRGLFEEADGGTLFLDEVGETSPAMQVKLLRVLQEGTFRPVGANEERSADVRIVTATNRDLESMVADGEFREDLYYRINVIPIHVPPLRDRREDIQAMVMHFVAVFSAEMNKEIRQVTPAALEALERHPWPGNVRELRNVIERSLALATSDVLDLDTLPERVREGASAKEAPEEARRLGEDLPEGLRLDDYLDDIRRRCIEIALRESGGNQTRAAERLQVTFRALRYYVQKYGLKPNAATGSEA